MRKSKLTLGIVLVLLLMVHITIVHAEEISIYTDGVFRGSGSGYNYMQDIVVEVTVEDNKIETITIVEHGESPGLSENAFVILDKILEVQSTDVDVISGASFTSRGLIEAVENALEKAQQ